MAGRLDWRTIALLTAAFSIAIVAAIAVTRNNAPGALAVARDPDAMPLDYADPGLRNALSDYGMFALGRGLDPIAPSCERGSVETYRFVLFPSDESFLAIDVVAGGGRARVEQRIFDRVRGNAEDYAWQVRYRRTLEPTEIDTLREYANRWLVSGKAASPGPHPIDASEWYLEMCRHGRYHFAARYAATSRPDENAEFLALAEAMRALHPSGDGGS